MPALSRIERAGFELALYGEGFKVFPASALTPNQRDFLKAHKAEIMTELQGQDWEYQDYTEPLPGPLVVTCYTPAGNPIQVEAKDDEHAAWLLQMNPQPKEYNHVRCTNQR